MGRKHGKKIGLVQQFVNRMQQVKKPKVLELGVKRSQPNRSTMHKDWAPHGEFVGTDFEDGLDVDVVADVHYLSHHFQSEQFEAVISCSTFEHIKYPWLAAIEIAKVMKKHAVLFIQTHQTYPLHAFPEDYWRFSTKGLEALFPESMGVRVLGSDYEFRAFIFAPEVLGAPLEKSYLNVNLLVEKVTETPRHFRHLP